MSNQFFIFSSQKEELVYFELILKNILSDIDITNHLAASVNALDIKIRQVLNYEIILNSKTKHSVYHRSKVSGNLNILRSVHLLEKLGLLTPMLGKSYLSVCEEYADDIIIFNTYANPRHRAKLKR
jgi:hypothetical protein